MRIVDPGAGTGRWRQSGGWAARMGAGSHFIGMIGADPFGDGATALYQAEGVGMTHVQRRTVRHTGADFMSLHAQGHNPRGAEKCV